MTLLRRGWNWIWANPAKTFIFGTGLFFIFLVSVSQQVRDDKVLKEDVVQYYAYLPATFIYNDLTMYYAHGNEFFSDKVWGHVTVEGAFVQKYTMGMALMYLPSFAMGHLSASIGEAPADGYSAPYEFWIQIGPIIYLVLGMWFLRKVLRRYFTEWTIAITLFTLIFATNLLYYSVAAGPMPHTHLFFLMSLFLFLTIRFHEYPKWSNALWLGLVGGLIVLVRPNHLIVWMVPVLYDLSKGKLGFWKKQLPKVLLWPVIVLVVVSPQLFYWKTLTGDWIFYSYVEEGFFFDDPKIGALWFSFRKGWLLYTPVMVLGIIGLFSFGSHTQKWRIPAWAFFLTSTYIFASWWAWWYGGSFGQRVYIDLFPILAIGMASLRHTIFPIKWLHRAFIGFILLCTLLNGFQTFQYVSGTLHYNSMTAEAYQKIFLQKTRPADLDDFLEAPDVEKAMKGDR